MKNISIDFDPNTIEQKLLELARKDRIVIINCDDAHETESWINSHIKFVRALIFEGTLFVIKL
jgi:hypothetical protein